MAKMPCPFPQRVLTVRIDRNGRQIAKGLFRSYLRGFKNRESSRRVGFGEGMTAPEYVGRRAILVSRSFAVLRLSRASALRNRTGAGARGWLRNDIVTVPRDATGMAKVPLCNATLGWQRG